MGGSSCSRGVGLDLLEQLELILEHDNLIDEVGFIHPFQFAALNEGSGGSLRPPVNVVRSADEFLNKDIVELNVVQYDRTVFWNRNHKLAISMEVLPQLYHAALLAYMNVSRSYKGSTRISVNINSFDNATDEADFDHSLESEILKHTRALLILSYDFNSAWNSRKLVLSRKHELSLFMDEFRLSTLILSYAPKSEYAWSHRRWVIKMVAEKFQNLQEIVRKESELVKKITENSKMNYRAWNHRCWLVLYMMRSQVLDELNKSRKWAELHVADNCCFHYRRRLILRMLDDNFVKQDGETCSNYNSDVYVVWKEELKWNELLIERYVGREALWVHRRFLFQCWIRYFIPSQQMLSPHLEAHQHISPLWDDFLREELHLLHTCLKISADEFDDTRAQAQYAASYILWTSKQIPLPQESKFQERLREVGDLEAILMKTCPEKFLLWERLLD